MSDLRRFAWALVGLAVVLAAGTVGFHLILELGWVSALVLLVAGVAIFLYVAGALVELIASGVLTGQWAERRRRRAIEKLRDHYIICGSGRVGRRIAADFRDAGAPDVVLDFSPDAVRAARELGDAFIEGNGTEDEDLRAAGLERARGLVASSDSDSDNLYTPDELRKLGDVFAQDEAVAG